MPRRLAWTLAVAWWLLSVSISLEFAHRTAIGPVIVNFSERHGVHAGDMVAVVAGAAAASVATWLLLSKT